MGGSRRESDRGKYGYRGELAEFQPVAVVREYRDLWNLCWGL